MNTVTIHRRVLFKHFPACSKDISNIVSTSLLSKALLSSLAFSNMNSSPEELPPLQVKLLSDKAKMPQKGSSLSAGFDLASAEEKIVKPNQRALVKTDIAVACPPGTYARVAARSGLAVKKGIDVGAGVVDADYRGPVGVVIFNFGDEDFEIKVGDRIAQLILEKISMVPAVQVEELDDTERGAAGFGSTGVASTEGSLPKKQRTVSPSNETEVK